MRQGKPHREQGRVSRRREQSRKGDSPESAGRLLEASGNGRPRGMIAAAFGGDPIAEQNSAYKDVDSGRPARFGGTGRPSFRERRSGTATATVTATATGVVGVARRWGRRRTT